MELKNFSWPPPWVFYKVFFPDKTRREEAPDKTAERLWGDRELSSGGHSAALELCPYTARDIHSHVSIPEESLCSRNSSLEEPE